MISGQGWVIIPCDGFCLRSSVNNLGVEGAAAAETGIEKSKIFSAELINSLACEIEKEDRKNNS